MIGLALLLSVSAFAAIEPTADETRIMLHCFARASGEAPWAPRPSEQLAGDSAFAQHLAKRCDSEVVPLYRRAYEMLDQQLASRGGRESVVNPKPLADQNILVIISQMLPDALTLRGKLPTMTVEEQKFEFDRWLLRGELADEASPISRFYQVSKCLAEQLARGDETGSGCGTAEWISDVETRFAAQYPEADRTVTAGLARAGLEMATVFAAAGLSRSSADDRKARTPNAQN